MSENHGNGTNPGRPNDSEDVDGFDVDSFELDESEFDETAAQLLLALPPVNPPAQLKGQVMEAIASTPQIDSRFSQRRESAGSSKTTASHADAETSSDDNVVEISKWRRTARWLSVAAAGLLVATVGLGGWAVNANQQRIEAQQQLNQTNEQRQQALDVFAAPDVVVRGTEADGGTVTVASSQSLNKSAIISRDLPELSDDKTYQLWYINDAGARPAGTFNADGGEFRALDGGLDTATSVGITVEPAGGSQEPTTEPIVFEPTRA